MQTIARMPPTMVRNHVVVTPTSATVIPTAVSSGISDGAGEVELLADRRGVVLGIGAHEM